MWLNDKHKTLPFILRQWCIHVDLYHTCRAVSEVVSESPSNMNESREETFSGCMTALQVCATCRSLADVANTLHCTGRQERRGEEKSKKIKNKIPAGWLAEGSWSCFSTSFSLSLSLLTPITWQEHIFSKLHLQKSTHRATITGADTHTYTHTAAEIGSTLLNCNLVTGNSEMMKRMGDKSQDASANRVRFS